MTPRLARGWATLLCALGYGVVGFGGLFAILPWVDGGVLERLFPELPVVLVRLGASGVLVLGALLIASPFVVAGHVLHLLVDQRRLLARIDRRLETAAARAAPSEPGASPERVAAPERRSTLVERLRPRG